MIRSKEARHRAVAVAQILGVAAVYYGSGRLGLLREVVVQGAIVTPLWPPTGVALGALLILGTRIWPGIALGALLTITATGGSVTFSGLGIVAGNTVAPLCAYLMLRRVDFRVDLARLRDGIMLVLLGAFVGMLISSTVGSVALLLSGKLPASSFWLVWSSWWAGDAMGVLVVTPLLLVLRRARLPRMTDRWVEASVLAVVTLSVGLLATRSTLSMIYLVFPVLTWAALRFQLPGSAPCAFLVSVLAIVAGTDGVGPFEDHSLVEIMVNLSLFNGCVALTALLLAAIVAEHTNIRLRTEHAVEELQALVEQFAPLSGAPPQRRPGGGEDHGPDSGPPFTA
ncbi:MASE1 domain-containing protein [Streptomyces sp. NPDC079020]|uniref:MASE1 domain-containing protein n=1 Tax=Streptomyces sp. NPDC079020 TaxID=3365722 RepID=UPI0037D7F7DB